MGPRKLDFRWDRPLKHFGKEFEEIQPGEVKLRDDNDVIGVLLTSDGVVDAFDVAFGHIQEIWFDDLNKLKQTIDFHFDGESYMAEGYPSQYMVNGGSLKLIYCPKLLKPAYENNHIHKMKYLYENEVITIQVYCPVKYSEATTFLEQWYEKVRKLNDARAKGKKR